MRTRAEQHKKGQRRLPIDRAMLKKNLRYEADARATT
jgi:hypothetical protein